MQTNLMIMERSDMGNQQKHSILANDLVRRLSNMSPTMTIQEHIIVIDKYTYKLKASGYIQDQSKEIILSEQDKEEKERRTGLL